MRRNRVRLTESQLHRVIKESVRRVLKEEIEGQLFGLQRLTGTELYDRIDYWLERDFGDAHVSRFDSDENNITLAVSTSIKNRQRIKEMMSELGYEYYTAGGNDGYLMMTFKPYHF